jgi:hypothetical protein
MDIETAMQVLEAEMDAEKEAMFYQGLQGLVSAGAQAYGSYKAKPAESGTAVENSNAYKLSGTKYEAPSETTGGSAQFGKVQA